MKIKAELENGLGWIEMDLNLDEEEVGYISNLHKSNIGELIKTFGYTLVINAYTGEDMDSLNFELGNMIANFGKGVYDFIQEKKNIKINDEESYVDKV